MLPPQEVELEAPTWLELVPTDELMVMERSASDVYEEAREIKKFPAWKSKNEIHQTIDHLKQLGKKLFSIKWFRRSEETFKIAYELAIVNGDIPDEIKSLFNSNMALCWLKLECPYECMEASRKAIELNSENLKAHHHLASSLYMIYEFKEALKHISLGLSIKPKCLELRQLERKIMTNEIPHKISQDVITERLKMFRKDFEPLDVVPLGAEFFSIKCNFDDQKLIFVKEAQLAIVKKVQYLKAKRFYFAYKELANLYHICHAWETKYQERFFEKIIYDVFSDKALCLYYFELYEESLKNCNYAKKLMKPNVNQLIFEVKILCKLNRFEEALEIIVHCSKFVCRECVEGLIMEEVLFSISINRDTQIANPDISFDENCNKRSGPTKFISNESKVGVKSRNDGIFKDDKEPKTINDFKGQNDVVGTKTHMRTCDTCKVEVPDDERSWVEHTNGKKHKHLLSCIRQEKNSKVKNMSTIDARQPVNSVMNLNKCDKIDVKTHASKELSSDEKNKYKTLIYDNKKLPLYSTLPLRKCSICDVIVGSSKHMWIGHTNSKTHKRMQKELIKNLNTPQLLQGEYPNKLESPFRHLECFESVNSFGDCDKNPFNMSDYSIIVKDKSNDLVTIKDHLITESGLCEVKTRSELSCEDSLDVLPEITNEWKVNLEPAQFWVKQGGDFAFFESFPLPIDTYDYCLVCSTCELTPGICLNCFENILAIKNKRNGNWIIIRERNGHGNFHGHYRLCHNENPCFQGRACTFAHSEEEEFIWNMEKDKIFSIRDFIQKHRSKNAPKFGEIELIYRKFPGFLSLICGECHKNKNIISNKIESGFYCLNKTDKHDLAMSKMFIYKGKANGEETQIFPHSHNSCFDICPNFKNCTKKGDLCPRPHSHLEQEIWMFLEQNKCSEWDFLVKFNEFFKSDQEYDLMTGDPPHVIKKICPTCSSHDIVSFKNPMTPKCEGMVEHQWLHNCQYYIPKAMCQMRKLPKIIPGDFNFKICWHVKENLCQVKECQFAHCQEELETWKWMAHNGIHDLGLVANKCEFVSAEEKAENLTHHLEHTSISRSKLQEKSMETAVNCTHDCMLMPAKGDCGSGRYKCQIHSSTANKIVARPLEVLNFEIIIPTKKHCKKALDKDEVVVEIINYEDIGDTKKIIYGEVVEILKRKFDIIERNFVCFIDEYSFAIMVPINKKVPKIKIANCPKKGDDIIPIFRCIHNKLRLQRTVKINRCDPYSYFYLVRILKWEDRHDLPLGIVLDTIKPGLGMDDVMKVLDLEFNIPEKLMPNAFSEAEILSKSDTRYDYTDMLVFTIDSIETTDIDDAIGFQIKNSKTILLSIHISDVSFYIDANSALDEEANKRATSYYPLNRSPIHMLPEQYSTDICSLKEGVDRRALSIFMTLDAEGNLIDKNIPIRRTLIRSRHKLTHEDVELVLMNDVQTLGKYSPELISALRIINKMTINWRKERLGSDASEWKTDIFCMDGPNSRALIEELMITANKIIAQFLLEKLPDHTPLRVQMPPNESELKGWRNEFSSIVSMTNGMRRYFKTFPEVCRCNGFCTCIKPFSTCDVEMPKDLWNEILNAFETKNSLSLRSLINDLNKLPQAAIAFHFLQKLQEKAEYVCSGEILNGHTSHFTSNIQVYTHFTSPIRRYIDLVVHRLVINCIEHQPPMYSQGEITEICQHCTFVSRIAKDYSKASLNALMCSFLQERPLKINATISKIDEKFEIELHSMNWHQILESQLVLKPSHLCLRKQPEADGDLICLSWEPRIYINTFFGIKKQSTFRDFDPCRSIFKLPPDHWLELSKSQKDMLNSGSKFYFDMEMIHDDLEDAELSSEDNLKNNNHLCESRMTLKRGSILTIQISSKLDRGLPVPFVQMIPLTKRASICVEHNSDPVKCFSDLPCMSASQKVYGTLENYKRLWKSVLSLEGADNAMSNVVPAIVHNIQITWEVSNSESKVFGHFQLEKDFCMKRGLKYITYSNESKAWFTYICVQYQDIMLPIDDVHDKIRKVLGKCHPINLTVHCLIIKATPIKKSNSIKFICLVKHHSLKKLNAEVLHSLNELLATVEWIEQTMPMRRMMNSLDMLTDELELAVNIALRKERPTTEGTKVPINLPTKLKPNSVQEKAIRIAMNSSFSLIQGPPGTGKTFVMAHLINQFYNANIDTEYQVMCCGPSNRAADVIAVALQKINPAIKLLRIYSESHENKCYPLPFMFSFIKEKVTLLDTDETTKKFSLHHLIRNPSTCPLAEEILRFEDEIKSKSCGEEGCIRKYMQLKKVAEQLLISEAKVIITTCIGVGGDRLKDCSIGQLLIDESGMCTEPESMVPIVGTGAQKIVLIGDHKQLRPIVVNRFAAMFGMDVSLFQSYNEDAFMLTEQYRMHEAIAEFPSKHFYDGKLTTGKSSQKLPSDFDFWPGGRSMPIAFVNIGGLEESLKTSTEEGGIESKKNVTQAQLAANIACSLVHHYGVKQKDIIILSQYRSQCTEISNRLKSADLSSVSVSTVVSAQGSEKEFVIISTVRSLPRHEIEKTPGRSWMRKHLGFVADAHQINVALTRAKKGLIILGNKELLGVNKIWKELIEHYKKRVALVDAEQFLINPKRHSAQRAWKSL